MLGSVVPTIGGLHTGFKIADEWKCDCIQIALTSRSWKLPSLTEEEIMTFKTAWKKSKVSEVVSHLPFLVNLASSDKTVREKSIRRLFEEIERAEILKVKYLVLHPGSYTISTAAKGVKNIVESLNTVIKHLPEKSPIILLETMAGQGTNLGRSFKELSAILKGLQSPKYVGICLDTAHIFQAGYNIVGYKGYKKVFEQFDYEIGLEQLKVIHLNDSLTDLGSKYDRHETIGNGKIGLQFFNALLREKQFNDIPKILEMPDRERSKEALVFLRELRKKERVPRSRRRTLSIDDFF